MDKSETAAERLIEAINRMAEALERQNELAIEALAAQRQAMAKADGMQSMLGNLVGSR